MAEGAKLKNIVVTVVVTPPTEENGPIEASHTVSVNGRVVENTQLGLVLAGDVQLGITCGVTDTAEMQAVARGARGMADTLYDRMLSSLAGAISGLSVEKAQPSGESHPSELVLAPVE